MRSRRAWYQLLSNSERQRSTERTRSSTRDIRGDSRVPLTAKKLLAKADALKKVIKAGALGIRDAINLNKRIRRPSLQRNSKL
ncbi:hypothetical protein EVAR_9666_1 [Eumeta japonica]|uniref:Uncharacterized protein n=1 Tax=Eumeta variegata TaxID=151549 RepID=A0A4C1TMY7_EUMVA|nr:hypothetical protein EVAR_9666_1 [Eumeta japonica]